ncbi:DinB family protein [Brevibacterium album]|uniref:DinB family protein n=1 Tax=Brevibacterium album TaxID=417948 RepID=UPI00041F7C9F|nr:DinB family protein [Brevibacterium album]
MGTETNTAASDREREDLIAMLDHARFYLRHTTRELTDEQARAHTTPSAFCLGDLIRHVTQVERSWCDFLLHGRDVREKEFIDWTEEDYAEHDRAFRMGADEHLGDLLDEYAQVAERTNAAIRTVPSLDALRELPRSPWSDEEAWSVRRAVLHIAAETAQHAGHADIIREALDGVRSMAA